MSEYFCSYVPQELEDNSRQNYQVSAKFSKILFCSVLFELFANATQNLQTASFVAELYLFLFQQYLLSVKFCCAGQLYKSGKQICFPSILIIF